MSLGLSYGFGGVPDPYSGSEAGGFLFDPDENAPGVTEPAWRGGGISGNCFALESDEAVDLIELDRSGTDGVVVAFSFGGGGNGFSALGAGFGTEFEDVLLLLTVLISREDPKGSNLSATKG